MGFGYAVYFIERKKDRVIRWDPDSGDVEVVAGEPNPRIADQSLSEPYGLAIDPAGSLLIADKHHHRICRVVNGRLQNIVLSDPTGSRKRRAGGKSFYSETRPYCPTSLFMEPAGSFLCTFSYENSIYRIHKDGSLEQLLGLPPYRQYMRRNYEPKVAAQDVLRVPLWMPTSIVEKKDGSLFFIERLVNTIRIFEPKLGLSCLFPWARKEDYAMRSEAPDRVAIQDYHPAHPGSLALDADDVLYIAEAQHGCVLKVDDRSGEVVKVIDLSKPVNVPKAGPAAIAFGPDGTAWVVNTSGRSVEAYAPTAQGLWKPMGTRLTQVRGVNLRLPPTGSGLVLGN